MLAFCIYVNTPKGPVPSELAGSGHPLTYPTRDVAERQIAKQALLRLQQFISGSLSFDEAIMVAEYIVDVTILPEGLIIDEADNCFLQG